MNIFSGGFSADSVRSYTQSKKDKEAEERRTFEAAARAEREKLHAAFQEREIRPEALDRIAALVQKMVDLGERQALVLQFPSEWLPDQGRAITNHDKLWFEKLDGFPKKAHDFFLKELEPRGFQLRAEIMNWPGGMPGDVGFYLTWKRPEEM